MLSGGVVGLSRSEMRQYLEYAVAEYALVPVHFRAEIPFPFLALQDVQQLTNLFERRVSAYQIFAQAKICLDAAF